MEQSDQNLGQRLESWRDGKASVDELTALIRDVGNQLYVSGIPALMQLLDHEDPIVRYNSAMALGFDLRHKPSTNKLLALLATDPDDDVRDVAAGALRSIWVGTKEPRILAALAQAALNDPDEYLRKSAYLALLFVNGLPPEEQLKLLTRPDSPSVDEERVKAILAEINR